MIAQVLQVQMITPPDLQKILAVLPVFHSKRPTVPCLAAQDVWGLQILIVWLDNAVEILFEMDGSRVAYG